MRLICLFEQSGTFKNQARLLGLDSFDYDILNDYNQTDFIIDLYEEIHRAFLGGKTIFDGFSKDDYIIAFFPCIRFEQQALLWFRGENAAQAGWSIQKKLEYCMKFHDELNNNYKILTELVLVCLSRGLKLIIENPYSSQHYLARYWCIKPSYIDPDRSENGDYYKKPTQYWFINCKPKFNLIFECQVVKERRKIIEEHGADRSMMSPEYANKFIREFILDGN